MKYLFCPIVAVLLFSFCSSPQNKEMEDEWVSLFNGYDFTGWEKYLSYQPESGNTKILGVNNDPENVYTIVDSTIRISGKIWGALTSTEEFENFHLKFDFKWGEKKWPPRDSLKRDSGVLYFCVGPHGAMDDHWMRSQEIQVQEEDCGDYWSLDGTMFDVEAEEIVVNGEQLLKYKPGGELKYDNTRRIIKSETNEKPHGEWNTMEVIADKDGNITHIVNGKVVLKASNSSQIVDGEKVPLRKGKIQIQSEGAEIFYRNIKIRRL